MSSKQYLVIDVGGTFIKSGLINEAYQLTPLPKHKTPDNLIDFVNQLEEIIKQQDEISGVAMSCAGQINEQNGYVFSGGFVHYLKLFPLALELRRRTGLPVTVMNDGNAAGLAEARLGGLKDCQYGAILVFGTSVGFAFVANSKLLSWKDIQPDLFEGNQERQEKDKERDRQHLTETWQLQASSFEDLIKNSGSAVNFVKKASQLLGVEEDGKLVFDYLEKDEHPELNQLFAIYTQNIATLVLNIRKVFKLEKVLVGGGISQQPLLIDRIRQAYGDLIAKTTFNDQYADLVIEAAQFNNDANLIGAFLHFQDLEQKKFPVQEALAKILSREETERK